ncbi:MAG: DUF4115 domain-containing protein [Endomicrobium sp.]|jgi:cytoskeletal protein RodZ|nr:DUF4115 domain-containing protein [Endomicrobium sp.]
MKELGKILRDKRDELGLDLEKAHKATKIQEKYILAIETGDETAFTVEIYYKSFVKSYAKFLGLNGADLLSLYEKRKCAKNEEETGEVYKNGKKICKSPKAAKEKSGDIKKLFVTVLIAGVLFASFLYLNKNISILTDDTDKISALEQKKAQLQKMRELQDQHERIEPLQQEEAVLASEEENKNKDLKPFPQKQNPAAKPAAAVGAAAKNHSVKQELVIDAVENVWIKVEEDGKEVFQGTLLKGAKKEWKANNEFVVKIGYTPGVDVYFNGDEIDVDKGAVQDVNTLVLTRQR